MVDYIGGVIVYANPAIDMNNMMDITSSEINDDPMQFQESFEGTTVTLYCADGVSGSGNSETSEETSERWSISTRKCFDARRAYWKSKRSIGEQVVCAIEKQTGRSYFDFLLTLDRSFSYTFVLTTYHCRTCIDYSPRFGTDYVVLHYQHMWDRKNQRIWMGPSVAEVASVAASEQPTLGHLEHLQHLQPFMPTKYSNLGHLATLNRQEQAIQSVGELTFEGVLVFNQRTKKMSKIQTNAYRVFTETSDYRDYPGSPMHLMRVYQQHGMDSFSSRFPSDMVFTSNSGNKLNAKGLIDIMFKLLTAELFGLFRSMGQQYSAKDDETRATGQVVHQMITGTPGLSLYRGIFAQIRTSYHSCMSGTSAAAGSVGSSVGGSVGGAGTTTGGSVGAAIAETNKNQGWTSRSGQQFFTSKYVLDILKATDVSDLLQLWNERATLFRTMESPMYVKILTPVIASIHSRVNVVNLLPMSKFVDEFVTRAIGIEQSMPNSVGSNVRRSRSGIGQRKGWDMCDEMSETTSNV